MKIISIKTFILITLFLIFIVTPISIDANNSLIIDMKDVRWSNHTYVYDGEIKKVELNNLPSNFPHDIQIIYKNNQAIEPGIYKARVEFVYDDGKYELINIKFQSFHEWYIRKNIIYSDDGTISIVSNYGIHPNHTVEYEKLDHAFYLNVDVSIAGAYHEVKGAFKIKLLDNGVQTLPDDDLTIMYKIPEELKHVTDLRIYDYSMNRLTSLNSDEKDGMIVFTSHYISETYLIIGIRSTYTNNEVWKALLIISVVGLGCFGVYLGRVVRKKKHAIKQDKELYTRSKMR